MKARAPKIKALKMIRSEEKTTFLSIVGSLLFIKIGAVGKNFIL
jgi:hypothetical protein